MVLQAIKYTRGQLEILDQLKLPHAEEYDHIYSSTDAWHAIKEMRTRGAPAIAIVAALALAVELTNMKLSSIAEEVKVFITEKLDYLVTSRPTAVNLADAAGKLRKITEDAAVKEGASGDAVREAYVTAAEKMLVDDVSDNESIGKHGAEWIVKNTEAGKKGPVSMMTHCNTGYVFSSITGFMLLTPQLSRNCRIRNSSWCDQVTALRRFIEACLLLRDTPI
jgi:methylthioribose-1-phosphate isomerase